MKSFVIIDNIPFKGAFPLFYVGKFYSYQQTLSCHVAYCIMITNGCYVGILYAMLATIATLSWLSGKEGEHKAQSCILDLQKT